jgi:transcriptional regulator with XRE-family HTH domain
VDSLEEWLTRPEGVATRLRDLRARAGLSGKDLAEARGWAQSKVSRIENGKQMASVEDIEAWADSCDASPDELKDLLRLQEDARVAHTNFRDRMKHGQQHVQEDYNQLVRESSFIRYYETVYVPGFLQVPDYIRRVLAEQVWLQRLDVDDVEASTAARMQRQQALYEPGKRFEFILAEPVLRWLMCPPAVMRAQLDRLQTVIGLERVRFGIIPMGVELKMTPQNSVQIYTGDDFSIAIVESFIGEQWLRGEKDVESYGRALDLLWEEAVTGEEARELIITATRALPVEGSL